jgi:hypothetical protein
MKKIASYIVGSLVLASCFGFIVGSAVGKSSADPARTVTVTVKDGQQGPQGPPGPPGPKGEKGDSGTITCPAGFEAGDLVINHPGGQVTIYGCLK